MRSLLVLLSESTFRRLVWRSIALDAVDGIADDRTLDEARRLTAVGSCPASICIAVRPAREVSRATSPHFPSHTSTRRRVAV